MRLVVGCEGAFACPICGQEYEIQEHEGGVAVVFADRYCPHLDLEILPTQRGGWEVYFSK
jgi:hypothetical protein